jgi:inosose dehydratase
VRIGYNTWSMARVPYQVFIPALAEMGYGAITLSVVASYGSGDWRAANACDLAGLMRDDTRRIREAFAQRGLLLPAVVGSDALGGDDAASGEAALRRLRDTIDFCVEVTPRGQPPPAMQAGVGGGSAADAGRMARLVERLGALAAYAAARGVVVAVEPAVGTAVDTPERAAGLVAAAGNPALRLDFDVSHFLVMGCPLEETVSRLVPLAASAEVKDHRVRALAGARPAGWRVDGNPVRRLRAADGREVEFQFLLGGEGEFDLPRYLRAMQGAGWTGPVAFEASVQCQARPAYDALAAAAAAYRWMAGAWRRAGVSTD